jgi:hypothetical protein
MSIEIVPEVLTLGSVALLGGVAAVVVRHFLTEHIVRYTMKSNADTELRAGRPQIKRTAPFNQLLPSTISFASAGAGSAIIINLIGQVGMQLVNSQPPSIVLPSRMFAGPGQYPPKQFKAYGIVAFNARPTREDKARYEMICDAYVSGLLHYTDVKARFDQQMVTVWPIENDTEASQINAIARDKVCARAVPRYGLSIAQEAIEAAKRNKAVLQGRGPFLLAWAPGAQKGQPDALVLVSNLSNVVNIEDSKLVFARWALDIQENPGLWNKGWDVDKLKILIRLWADRYGDDILNYFKG